MIIKNFRGDKLIEVRSVKELLGADLRYADLNHVDLSWANLEGADLRYAHMYQTNLAGANLLGAKFISANLNEANLRGAYAGFANFANTVIRRADLSGASLENTNFICADLTDADLRGANLTKAHLLDAKLTGAKLSMVKPKNLSHLRICPLVGEFEGWKMCQKGVLVRLKIPTKAKRSNGTSRKCRAEFVEVLEVIGAKIGWSRHDSSMKYCKGEIIHCEKWDGDQWRQCGGGIHFFLTREEAEEYE